MGARGRPGLTPDRIVEAAIAVAAADGLAAVSMSRLATELGVATMSLYHHVASKDQLMALMFDGALGSPPAIPLRGPWRDGLETWSRALLTVYRQHPWLLQVTITTPPMGRNNIAWLESALRAMLDTPLAEQRKLSTTLLLNGHVRSQAGLPADLGSPAPGPGYGQSLARLIDPIAYPALHQAVTSGALDDHEGLSGEFEFGLRVILDGVAALIGTEGPAQ